MTPGDADRYARVSDILAGARECHGDALEVYLDGACGKDAPLRAEVLELLALARADDGERDAFGDNVITNVRVALEAVVDGATDAWLPDVIGSYRIVRQIGRGGMSIVYEATQQSPKRSVAIKLLHPIQATSDRLRRFRREAEMLGRLQHPGIAQIFEASTYDIGHGAQPFFAMELVDGVDIRTHCERAGLDQRARIALLAEVADAVDHAHGHGVVHRDLKPGNVLVDSRGRPRVLDFGIAHVTGDTPWSTMMTQNGQLVGTLGYMAPEQLTAAATEVTPLVDVYSLGVLGFELLTRRLPCDVADQPISKAIAMLTATAAPLASRFERSLVGDIDTILGKALEADPARRYPSAAALASDLRRFLKHEPIQARPPSRTYLVKKFTQRHRALVGGALATLLTLVAGTATSIVFAEQAGQQRDLALTNENRAINSLLQSAQTLIDAGRGRDAVTQLRLVPEAARGVAWRLLDRAVPFVIDEVPGNWLFVDDEHMVGLRRQLPTDLSRPKKSSILLYSLVDHRPVREIFAGISFQNIERAASCGIVVAVTMDEAAVADEVLLLDLEREAVLERGPAWHIRGTVPVPAGQPGAGGNQEVAHARMPELSDDGRTILWYTSASKAEIRVDGKVVREATDLGLLEAAHLGPDGKLLVVNRRTEVSVLDVASGAVRFHYEFASDPGASGIPVRGGVVLHSALEAYPFETPRVWRRFEIEDGAGPVQPASPFATGCVGPTPSHDTAVDFPRDGRFCAIAPMMRGTAGALLANTQTGAPLPFSVLTARPEGGSWFLFDEGIPQAVRVAPSGCRLAASGSFAQTKIVELDPRDGLPDFDARALTLRGHQNPAGAPGGGWIYHLAVSNDGSLIASAAPEDLHIRVWDTRTGDCIATLERHCGHRDTTNPGSWEALMAFRADDQHLLVTTPFGDKGLSLVDWDLLTGEVALLADPLPIDTSHLSLLDRFIDALAPKNRARLSQRVAMQDGQALVAFQPPTPGLGTYGMPRPKEGKRWRYLPNVDGHAPGLSVHPSLPQAAVVQAFGLGVTRMGRLTVLDTRSGQILMQRELTHLPWCAAYSPDGGVLAIGTNLGDVLLFETERYTQQLMWRAHGPAGHSYIYSLAWTADGTRLVTASGDETVRIWDTRTRVASRLVEDRWAKLRATMAARDDLPQVFDSMRGEEREAARVERIRRAHRR